MKVTQAAINRLKDQTNRKRNKKRLRTGGLTLDSILHLCTTHFNIPAEDIQGASRKEELVQVRHCYCWLAIHHTGYNLPEISAKINREQTAVIWALKSINSQIEAGNIEVCSHLLALQNAL
jgi:chromosomal replication initiation ATPase DnaA